MERIKMIIQKRGDLMKIIRVSYGKPSIPKDKREYQINGFGAVGTLKEFKETFPFETFEIIDNKQR